MEQFFTSLFDFSFKRFITPSIIRILYILCIAASTISAIGMILAGFGSGFVSGAISLVLAPLVFVASVCFYRVVLEVILNVFRIANYAAEVARWTRRDSAGGSTTAKPRSPEPDFGDDPGF